MNKSIRLNVGIRSQIAISLLSAWDKANPKPVNNPKDLALEYMNTVICMPKNSEQFKGIEAYLTSTEDSECCLVVANGHRHYVNTADLDSGYMPNLRTVTVTDSAWLSRFVVGTKAQDDREASRFKFNQNIKAVLSSVNTTRQLVEVWPEVEAHLPAHVADPSKINLPAVVVESLNNQLEV